MLGTRSRSPARWFALFALALLLAVYAWWPMISAYPNTEPGDGQVYLHRIEAMRVSVADFHELPLWNPWECAGTPLWDDPESYVGAPLIWLSLWIGSTKTVVVWILAHVAFAFVAMWIFARDELRISRLAAFVAAGAWAFCGFHQHHYSGGHLTFTPYVALPLAIFLWRRAEASARAAVGLGVLVAWMFYEGGVYPLPHTVVLLLVEAAMRFRSVARAKAIARAGAIVAFVAVTLSAPRLFPVLDQLRTHARQIEPDVDALRWTTLGDMFLARAHGRGVLGQQYVWTEWGAYLGPIVLGLALVGLVLGGGETLWLVVVLAAAVALMAGHQGKYAPWHLLHEHVPPFKEMRVPSRFRAAVSMILAAFAGVAVDKFDRARGEHDRESSLKSAFATMVVAVGLIGVGDIASVGQTVIAPFFTAPPTQKVTAAPSVYIGGPALAQYVDQPAQHRAQPGCWDPWAFSADAPVWFGDVPQVRAQDASAKVLAARRTPNTFVVEVVATQPARLLFNTSYERGWRTDVGATFDRDRLLAVDVPAGHHTMKVRYWPRGMSLGIATWFVGLAGAIALWRREARRASTIPPTSKAPHAA